MASIRPVIRATGAWAVGSTGTLTVTLPTHQAGDLLILHIAGTHNASGTPTTTVPAGWTSIGTIVTGSGTRRSHTRVCAMRAASAAETNPASTCSPTGTAIQYRGRAVSIQAGTWRDTGTLTDAWEDVTTNTGTASTVALTGLAATVNAALALACVDAADDTPTGCTDDGSFAALGTNHDSATSADGFSSTRSRSVESGQGAATFTFTAGGTIGTSGVSFVLHPLTSTDVAGSSAGAAAASGTAVSLDRTATPTLSSVTPNPVTVGQALTVSVALAAAEDALTGSAAGVGAAAGGLGVAVPLGGTSAGAAGGAAAAGVAVPLGGASAGAAAGSGTPQATAALGGAGAGAGAASGAPGVAVALGGSSAGQAGGQGTPDVAVALGGASAGQAGAVGGFDAATPLTGSAAGTGAASGTPSATVDLGGASAGQAGQAGDLTAAVALGGSAAGAAGQAGTVGGAVDLSGAAAGQAAASGTVAAQAQTATPYLSSVAPSPVTVGQALTVSVLAAPPAALVGSSAGAGAAAGTPGVAVGLAGAAAGTGGASGTPALPPIPLPTSLEAGERSGGTATPSGDDLVFAPGAWAEYLVDALDGGDFELQALITAVAAGQLRLLVDGVPVATRAFDGDGMTALSGSAGGAAGATATSQAQVAIGGAGAGAASASGTVPGSEYALPADRRVTWELAGVPGGIPTYTTIHSTIAATSGDRRAAIQAAVDAAAAVATAANPQVVKLGSGTFDISDTILKRSYVVVRGDGFNDDGTARTLIRCAPNVGFNAFQMGEHYPNNINDVDFMIAATGTLSQNAVKDALSVRLTVGAASLGFAAGQLVVVDELTDENTSQALAIWNPPYSSAGDERIWYSRSNRLISQMLLVDRIDAGDPNVVWFTTPLHWGFRTSLTAQLSRFIHAAVVGAGVEDLRVFKSYDSGGMYGYDASNVKFGLARHCWTRRVEVDGSAGSAVGFRRSFQCEARDVYAHDTQYYRNGGWGYGVDFSHGAALNLVENSIIIRFNKVSNMRASGGGNVVGLVYTDDGAIDGSPDWIETGLQGSHHPCPHHELFEGSRSWNADGDWTTGSAIYATFFRNRLTGSRRHTTRSAAVYGTAPTLVEGGPKRCAGGMFGHLYYSFLGNVLGEPGVTDAWLYEAPSAIFDDGIWALGWTDEPDPSSGVVGRGNGWIPALGGYANDPRVGQTMLRDGNFDYRTNEVRWHGIGGAVGAGTPATLPKSLYRTRKPAFMGPNRWPWVDPIGATKESTLPAKARYDAGTSNIIPHGQYPGAMELLSRSVPATSSAGATEAGDAQDATYASDIFGTSNYAQIAPAGGWVALDLSGVAEHKRRVLLVGLGFNGADGALNRAWSAGQDDATPTAYVLEAATSSGGPWTALATVNEVRAPGRSHVLSFYGYTWLRFRSVSGPGCSLKMHVFDAYRGVSDGWAFLGDSIMMDAFSNRLDNGQGDQFHRFALPVNAAHPEFFPHVVGGGIGGAAVGPIADLINTATGEFATGVTIPYKTVWREAKYAAICYGANDINQGVAGLPTYLSGYLAAVDAFVAQGQTVVIPTMGPGSDVIDGFPFNTLAKRYIGKIGLHAPAWSAATYAVEDHRWNGGRIYRCSVAGTSVTGPTGTGTNISDGGTARWDYVESLRELRADAVRDGKIIAGPDVMAALSGHPEYLRDGLHHTAAGQLAWWSAWASWANSTLYGPAST